MDHTAIIDELEREREKRREVCYTWAIFGKPRLQRESKAAHDAYAHAIEIVKKNAGICGTCGRKGVK